MDIRLQILVEHDMKVPVTLALPSLPDVVPIGPVIYSVAYVSLDKVREISLEFASHIVARVMEVRNACVLWISNGVYYL